MECYLAGGLVIKLKDADEEEIFFLICKRLSKYKQRRMLQPYYWIDHH